MNLGDMIEVVASKKGISKKAAKEEIEFWFGTDGLIADGLKTGGAVKLGDLGTVKLVKRAERKGRNPQTGEEMTIPAKTTATFKPSKEYQATL